MRCSTPRRSVWAGDFDYRHPRTALRLAQMRELRLEPYFGSVRRLALDLAVLWIGNSSQPGCFTRSRSAGLPEGAFGR